MGAKRAVPGRSLPYDILLSRYIAKNEYAPEEEKSIHEISYLSEPDSKESVQLDKVAQTFKQMAGKAWKSSATFTTVSSTISRDNTCGESARQAKLFAEFAGRGRPCTLISNQAQRRDINDQAQGDNGVPTTCTNCFTQTTPLWRRNPEGHPLCNACGLFLKLHGRVRPLSLKTDLVKKRNWGSGASLPIGGSGGASKIEGRDITKEADDSRERLDFRSLRTSRR
jgi:hypothetical protein